MDQRALERYADFIVGFGANVQPGQIVSVSCSPGREYLTRAVAASAYRHGAKFVDVAWFDPHVKRARIEFAAEDTLDFVPSWYGERVLAIGEQRGATIGLTGPETPGLFDGLDPARVGRDRLPMVKESMQVVNAYTVNWTVAAAPTLEWAKMVFPNMEDNAALAELERMVFVMCRLDEDDPMAAWEERITQLKTQAAALTSRRFDSIHFIGPGTDLKVGLLPSSNWAAAGRVTVDGIAHRANVPTEETFTTPDPLRVDGFVTSTRPLVLRDGTVVSGLRIKFEGGRAVDIQADEGGDILRALVDGDEGGARLGEVALVDREGRVGQMNTVFYTTLLDENAASHIAFGAAYALVDDKADLERINVSGIHIDFMIGSNDVDTFGITGEGESVPLLKDGRWQI